MLLFDVECCFGENLHKILKDSSFISTTGWRGNDTDWAEILHNAGKCKTQERLRLQSRHSQPQSGIERYDGFIAWPLLSVMFRFRSKLRAYSGRANEKQTIESEPWHIALRQQLRTSHTTNGEQLAPVHLGFGHPPESVSGTGENSSWPFLRAGCDADLCFPSCYSPSPTIWTHTHP